MKAKRKQKTTSLSLDVKSPFGIEECIDQLQQGVDQNLDRRLTLRCDGQHFKVDEWIEAGSQARQWITKVRGEFVPVDDGTHIRGIIFGYSHHDSIDELYSWAWVRAPLLAVLLTGSLLPTPWLAVSLENRFGMGIGIVVSAIYLVFWFSLVIVLFLLAMRRKEREVLAKQATQEEDDIQQMIDWFYRWLPPEEPRDDTHDVRSVLADAAALQVHGRGKPAIR